MAKYTDEQIKKGLWRCSYQEKVCPHCHFQETGKNCKEILMKNALDLINRQEAEIEALNAKADKLKDECATLEKMYMSCLPTPQTATSEHERTSRENILCKEIERLKKDNEYILMQHKFQRRPDGNCWNDVIEKAKSEAIKEFAERLKKLNNSNLIIWNEQIDNLVKEMVGEGE